MGTLSRADTTDLGDCIKFLELNAGLLKDPNYLDKEIRLRVANNIRDVARKLNAIYVMKGNYS